MHTSAESALAADLGAGMDVFIIDIGLPGMNGHDMARRRRANPDTTNAVLVGLSGYGRAHDRELARTAGFDHYFVKPIGITELEGLITQLG